MSSPDLYALLIGINCYYPNRLSDGSSYRNLEGAVGDVKATRSFLQTLRKVPDDHILQLTSTLNPETGEPIEPPEQLPTYANIIQRFKELGTLAPVGSQVYIHYSGHGGRSRTNYPQLKGGDRGIDESLVPMDIGQTDGQYVRDVELGALLKELVKRGLIVTVVLDSCHSGEATRGESAVRGLGTIDETPRPVSHLVNTPEALAEAWEPAAEGTRALQSGWLSQTQGYVVIAACRPNEYAFEYAFDPDSRDRSGALTHWLLDTLRQQTGSMTYKDLHDRLNGKIRSQFAQQTPMLVGDSNRLIFGSDRADIQYSIPVITVDRIKKTVRLEAGQATGLRLGAEFAIYPNGTQDFSNSDDRLAIVKIDNLGSTTSQGPLEAILGQQAVDEGDIAILIAASTNLVKKVQLVNQQQFGDEENALQALRSLLRLNPWLTLVESGTPTQYTIAVNAEGSYEIGDQSGVAIPNLRPLVTIDEPNATRKVVDRLVHLAKYHATESLDNFDKNSPLFGKLQVSWAGKLASYDPADAMPDVFEPFDDPTNPTVRSGECAFLKIQNNFNRAVNIAVLDLQSDWAIHQSHPIDPGAKFEVLDAGQTMTIPFPLTTGEGYSQSVDVIKVFAAIDSPNFRWLELPALDQPLQSMASRSGDPLEALFASIGDSAPTSRDVSAVRYPSREWTTQQLRITTVKPDSQDTSTRSLATHQPLEISLSEMLVQNQQKLIQGQNSFNFQLFSQIHSTQDSVANVLISPLSISIALLLLFNACEPNGPLQIAILKAFGFRGMTLRDVNEAAHVSLRAIADSSNPQLKLNLANSVWILEGITVEASRVQALVDYYDADVQSFGSDPVEAAAIVNQWIATKTEDKIQNMLQPKNFRDAVALLINAVYFKASWATQFSETNTYSCPIHQFLQRQPVMMMTQTGKFEYTETDTFQAIRLPYANSSLCMDIFLPKPDVPIQSFQNLVTAENWTNWVRSFQEKEGTIDLPRFKLEYRQDLIQVIQSLLGLKPLLIRLASDAPLDFVSQIIHQAILEVNEEGSEAAAATVVVVTRGMDPNTFRMRVDRPFMSVIHDRSSGLILFMGIIHDPK
jgi:serine protease inhibitor